MGLSRSPIVITALLDDVRLPEGDRLSLERGVNPKDRAAERGNGEWMKGGDFVVRTIHHSPFAHPLGT